MKFPRVWETEMKNSDPKHPKALSWVNYLPHLLAKLNDSIAFKLIGTPSYLIKFHKQLHCTSKAAVSSTLGGAEIKNSDPNHPKALYRVYYPTHLLPKNHGLNSV